ncbi:hypothetical protein KXQ82_08975 [Mucilaginibacter sp. HMF5004]|uniref:hypothetical protein n=1 Tax=Mucilaginibacter rivuli TaxID=2857527 RepID=UPI001C5E21E3|nr:hypothetical protein [Mucilaginibacter rivuli]MBW4889847.1 hypothetical protein [Mucilaginibacter rivuli]
MNQKQEDLILMIFKTHYGEWLTPAQVRAIMCAITGTDALITSVRRAITNLTKQAKLVKSENAIAKGPHGAANHVWTAQ